MNLYKSTLLLIIILLSYNSLGQYQLKVKIPESAEVKINGMTVKQKGKSLVINSANPDSVRLESIINGKLARKSFLLRQEMNTYVLVENMFYQYVYRLRSNLTLDSVAQLDLSQFPGFKVKQKMFLVNKDSLQFKIEEAQFEFEKVNIILDFVEKNPVDIAYVKELCRFLKHDFTKWRVVELVSKKTENKSELSPLIEVFSSDNYKNQLINNIEKK